MRKTAILGIGQTPVNEHWELSLRDLAGQAILEALNDLALDQIRQIVRPSAAGDGRKRVFRSQAEDLVRVQRQQDARLRDYELPCWNRRR